MKKSFPQLTKEEENTLCLVVAGKLPSETVRKLAKPKEKRGVDMVRISQDKLWPLKSGCDPSMDDTEKL